jgi:hypothetical protein
MERLSTRSSAGADDQHADISDIYSAYAVRPALPPMRPGAGFADALDQALPDEGARSAHGRGSSLAAPTPGQ